MLSIITLNASGQEKLTTSIDTTSNSVGTELMLAYKQHSTGMGVIVLGGATMFASTIINKDNNDPTLMVVGGFITLIGSAITLNSWRHFEKAGLLMNERGIGIKITL